MKNNKKTLAKIGLAVGIPSAIAFAMRKAYTTIRYGEKPAKDTVPAVTAANLYPSARAGTFRIASRNRRR